ncbi:2'-5' RNA ligase family protein [Algoriphagus halophytocola]|uniref:2'-5' RNA ligase family protein n=1 Tax=Algoriphagus halophytocola TaxID=2991499 RepID=A0ABY6MHS1_9BACT|nr:MULTISPECIES: 2'-5' RNA ligase family protein [unclassified Algoriphagus]UZD21729.1 2'-5' RNA ligase family protein [Algoriphagus sp. TR-M5]WBL42941.1 2'-5' RNA ligase family protein [Algoriphagus sp. TR-M9]
MQKYFLALVPEGKIQDEATALKYELKDAFNVKYALKSPAHVTMKMPFVYNEAKEGVLLAKLRQFTQEFHSMKIQVDGVETFGQRVIFLGIAADADLISFQQELKLYCKRELNLVDELSDRNFHPHMTIAFKDLKKNNFQQVLDFAKAKAIQGVFEAQHLCLLKRESGRWTVYQKIDFGKK